MNETLRTLQSAAVIVDPQRDSVAVAKDALPAGSRWRSIDGQALEVREEIAPGHRVAIRYVPAGEWVLQYGQPFARSRGLQPGDPVNEDTVDSVIPQIDPQTVNPQPAALPPWEGTPPTFLGFHRLNGQVGTRNWVLVVPTSMCSSHEASTIAMQAELGGLYSREQYPNVDGVTAIPHTRGCGCPDLTPGGGSLVEVTMRMLAGYIRHPNVGAAIVIELGCEKTNLDLFERYMAHPADQPEGRVRRYTPVDLSEQFGKPVISLSVQGLGGTRATVKRGLELLPELLAAANQTGRRPAPANALGLGLQCGGSDAFSGLTANPALGAASDLLVRAGGTSIISEVPEFFGAEHLFAARAVNRKVAQDVFAMIDRYRKYTERSGRTMAENPSPGNKAGGLLNITIKSLGALAKGGVAPLQGVLDYAETYPAGGGLYLMYGPGYDQESVPPLVAGGCQVVCFTTGRGTGIGNAIAPVIKIASNTPMYERMQDNMDINAGSIMDGTETVASVGRSIFEEILAVASGKWTNAEETGHREFAIWSEEGISL